MDKIRALLQAEFGRHHELMNSENIASEKQYFLKIMNGTPTEVELTSALEFIQNAYRTPRKGPCHYHRRI